MASIKQQVDARELDLKYKVSRLEKREKYLRGKLQRVARILGIKLPDNRPHAIPSDDQLEKTLYQWEACKNVCRDVSDAVKADALPGMVGGSVVQRVRYAVDCAQIPARPAAIELKSLRDFKEGVRRILDNTGHRENEKIFSILRTQKALVAKCEQIEEDEKYLSDKIQEIIGPGHVIETQEDMLKIIMSWKVALELHEDDENTSIKDPNLKKIIRFLNIDGAHNVADLYRQMYEKLLALQYSPQKHVLARIWSAMNQGGPVEDLDVICETIEAMVERLEVFEDSDEDVDHEDPKVALGAALGYTNLKSHGTSWHAMLQKVRALSKAAGPKPDDLRVSVIVMNRRLIDFGRRLCSALEKAGNPNTREVRQLLTSYEQLGIRDPEA